MIINAVIKASSRQVFSEEVCFAILDFNKNQALSHSGEHLCCAVRLLQMPRKQSSGLCYQFIHNSKFIHTHTSPLCTSKPGSDKNLFHTFPLQLHWKQWIFAQSGLGVLYVLITFTSMPTPTVFINRKSSNFGLENVKDCPLESLAVLSLNNRTICAGNCTLNCHDTVMMYISSSHYYGSSFSCMTAWIDEIIVSIIKVRHDPL